MLKGVGGSPPKLLALPCNKYTEFYMFLLHASVTCSFRYHSSCRCSHANLTSVKCGCGYYTWLHRPYKCDIAHKAGTDLMLPSRTYYSSWCITNATTTSICVCLSQISLFVHLPVSCKSMPNRCPLPDAGASVHVKSHRTSAWLMHTCVSGVPAELAALFSTSDAWVAWANLEGPAPFALAPGLRGVP